MSPVELTSTRVQKTLTMEVHVCLLGELCDVMQMKCDLL